MLLIDIIKIKIRYSSKTWCLLFRKKLFCYHFSGMSLFFIL